MTKYLINDVSEMMLKLGRAYKRGWGVKQDQSQAQQWYAKYFASLVKRTKDGDRKALYYLGKAYRDGIDVKRDLEKSKAFFSKWISLVLSDPNTKNTEIFFYSGYAYEHGIGVGKDPEKAQEMFKKRIPILIQQSEFGDHNAMQELALAYQYGRGLPKNLYKAQYYYTKKANILKEQAQKNPDEVKILQDLSLTLQQSIGITIDKTHSQELYNEWVPVLKKLIETGDFNAMWQLGRAHEYGDGVEKDAAKAKELFAKRIKIMLENMEVSNTLFSSSLCKTI